MLRQVDIDLDNESVFPATGEYLKEYSFISTIWTVQPPNNRLQILIQLPDYGEQILAVAVDDYY